MPSRLLTIDLITHRPSDDAFILVAVEEGPWEDEEIESKVQRLELRLCDYVQCVVSGRFAEEIPDSYGEPIIIRLDCYGVSDGPVRPMFDRLQRRVFAMAPLQHAIDSGLIQRLGFEYNWRRLPTDVD